MAAPMKRRVQLLNARGASLPHAPSIPVETMATIEDTKTGDLLAALIVLAFMPPPFSDEPSTGGI